MARPNHRIAILAAVQLIACTPSGLIGEAVPKHAAEALKSAAETLKPLRSTVAEHARLYMERRLALRRVQPKAVQRLANGARGVNGISAPRLAEVVR